MADQKHDYSMQTGVHRPWVGESSAGLPQAPTRSNVASRDALRTWPNRTQGVDKTGGKVNARHAAITKRLANFPSYKTWAEKTKATWEQDKSE